MSAKWRMRIVPGSRLRAYPSGAEVYRNVARIRAEVEAGMSSASECRVFRDGELYEIVKFAPAAPAAPDPSRCACAELPEGSRIDWPNCPGVMRSYPSGRRACDCGDHVEPAAVSS